MSAATILLATTVAYTVQTATHPDDFKNFDNSNTQTLNNSNTFEVIAKPRR